MLRWIRPVIASGFILSAPAAADEVVLKDGETVSGVAERVGDEVRVRLDFGSITFDASEVAEIRSSPTNLALLETKRAKVRSGDANGLYRLGLWAEQAGLPAQARGLFEEVLSLAPDHAGARKALGFVKHEGRWLTEDEHMQAKGFVRQGDRWLSPEAVAALEAEQRRTLERKEAELATARLELLEARLTATRARAEQAEREARAAREAAEATRTMQNNTLLPYWPWTDALYGRGGGSTQRSSFGLGIYFGGAGSAPGASGGAPAQGGAAPAPQQQPGKGASLGRVPR